MRSLFRYSIAFGLCIALSLFILPNGDSAKTELSEEDIGSATFTNYLDWTIYYLFISPSDSEYYGADVMDSTGALVLGSYESLLLYLVPGEYDVLILDEDYDMWYGTYTIANGDEVILSEATLTYEEYGVDDALITIEIWVETSLSVDYLFLSPADSDRWGIDLLGIGSLEPDDILPLTLPEYDTTQSYDLLAVYEDGQFITISVDGTDGADIYLFEPAVGDDDDDDVVADDDDDINITDDDDDVVVDDDDVVTDDDDDDDVLPPGEQPGGVSGGGLEGDDEKKKDSSALGIVAIIATMSILIGFKLKKRKN